MKKNFFTYLIFISALALFFFVRIYAGNNQNDVSGKTESVNTNTSDSVVPTAVPSTPVPTEQETDISSQEAEHGTLNDPWHGDFTPVKSFRGALPRIVCWGDSLTSSWDNKTAYPDRLRDISGLEVINYGVEAESTKMIAMRQGGFPVMVGATVIPAGQELIPVFLKGENGDAVFYLDHGDAGINPCEIAGISGTLSKLNGAYYFKREESGQRVSVSDEVPFVTHGMKDNKAGDVLVIFTGTNDMPNVESVYDIIKMINDMLAYAKCDKYIIIGLTYAGGMSEIDKVNEILSNEYEDNFLDIRTYLLNYGLEDAGLTATAKDHINISEGEIPESLRNDYVHGNKYFYDLLAKQVYRRLQYLGYVPLEE